MKKTIVGICGFLAIIIAIFLLQSPPIDPAAYIPAYPPPPTGTLAPNTLLSEAEFLADGKINGPEDIAMDSQGRIYGGTRDGKIKRLLRNGTLENFTETQGCPLGLEFDNHGNLIVCDALRGLLSIDPTGQIKVLLTSADGVSFKFTNALDVARDGTVYFTDSSSKYGPDEHLYDLLESKPHGRFMGYDPVSGEVRVLLKGLYFANGVALSDKEDFVLINETYRYRVIRYWLKGPAAGTWEVFIDNLPGFPDNISSNGNGKFWLALFTVRNKALDSIHPYPFVKAQLSKIPGFLWPEPEAYGLVLALDEQGKILQSLHDPSGKHLSGISSAREYEGHLYLGTLANDRIGKYRLP
ncbi:MAG: SMP-30/gluconolactonase/LRE family protein [Desulfobacterium sp.]|nr:SMP-30/gluconolactonase/LRE family protein [Desulfobacterium sp.]